MSSNININETIATMLKNQNDSLEILKATVELTNVNSQAIVDFKACLEAQDSRLTRIEQALALPQATPQTPSENTKATNTKKSSKKTSAQRKASDTPSSQTPSVKKSTNTTKDQSSKKTATASNTSSKPKAKKTPAVPRITKATVRKTYTLTEEECKMVRQISTLLEKSGKAPRYNYKANTEYVFNQNVTLLSAEEFESQKAWLEKVLGRTPRKALVYACNNFLAIRK